MAMIKISAYIAPERIVFLSDDSMADVLNKLCEISKDMVENVETFKEAILNREKIMSTGLGMGFAFPHVKMNGIKNFFITVGILAKSVDWDALDGQPVRVVFLIGGPEGEQNKYLSILSKLSLIVKNATTRKKIMNAATHHEVLKILSDL